MSRVRKATEVILTQSFEGYEKDTVFRVKHMDGDAYVCFKGPAEDIHIPKRVSRWRRAA